jgi:SAM-dependent methyltransferase
VRPEATAYAGMAQAWAADAGLAYGPLARHLVARAPIEAAGALALDAGAGSGLAGAVLREQGARVLAADREYDMAAHVARVGPAVAADVCCLPFRDTTFDLVVAAFVLNHLPDPVAGARELRRVTRVGGAVLVSTFSSDRARAKNLVDQVAASYGFTEPDWYLEFKSRADAIGDRDALGDVLRRVGFPDVTVTESAVDVGIVAPSDVVRYRLGLPQLRAFVSGLEDAVRQDFLADAAAAVAASGEPFRPRTIEAVAIA